MFVNKKLMFRSLPVFPVNIKQILLDVKANINNQNEKNDDDRGASWAKSPRLF